jgi:hypothetical protein
MRRALALTTLALTVALVPAAAFAQDPAAAAPAQPAAPKVGFTTPAGMLLATIKADQTAVFEEMIAKLKAGAAKATDEKLKAQAAGLKVYKAAEPAAGGNALYVLLIEPAAGGAEYELFNMLQKTMTADELRAPETAEMWKRFSGAFAAGLNKLSLTPVGGGL